MQIMKLQIARRWLSKSVPPAIHIPVFTLFRTQQPVDCNKVCVSSSFGILVGKLSLSVKSATEESIVKAPIRIQSGFSHQNTKCREENIIMVANTVQYAIYSCLPQEKQIRKWIFNNRTFNFSICMFELVLFSLVCIVGYKFQK